MTRKKVLLLMMGLSVLLTLGLLLATGCIKKPLPVKQLAAGEEMEIDHDETGFPLRGHHQALACAQCHGADFDKTPKPVCSSCHQSPHQGFKKKSCETCHQAGLDFARVSFRHPADGMMRWHQADNCRACHVDLAFQRAAPDCSRCHSDFHLGALGSDCARCHHEPAWQVPRYDHLASGIPRRGAHLALECGDCHRDLRSFRISPPPTDCVSCHEADQRRASFPHARYGAGPDCAECHGEDSFQYAHSPRWYNLQTGPMRGLECSSCHKDQGNYRQYSCHDCHRQHENDNGGRCLDCHLGGFSHGDRP